MQIDEYHKLEQSVYYRFLESDLKKHFVIKHNIFWKSINNKNYEFDIVLEYKNQLYAIIEVKSEINSKNKNSVESRLNTISQIAICNYYVYTDGKEYYYKFISDKSNSYKLIEFDRLINLLVSSVAGIYGSNDDRKNFFTNLKSFLKNLSHTDSDFDKFNSILSEETICKENDHYRFKEIKNERDFIKNLLNVDNNPNENEELYRYISYDTFVLILKHFTYRMCGVACMNDKTEANYLQVYANEHYEDIQNDNAMMNQGSSCSNQTYITSCCELEDDLSMWRQYGDDGQGVCLVFEHKENFNYEEHNFYFAKINYAEKHIHNAMDFIIAMIKSQFGYLEMMKNITTELLTEIGLGHIKVAFLHLLLILILIALYPFRLKKIILGPKFPEVESNIFQIKEYIKLKKYNIDIDESTIKSYR